MTLETALSAPLDHGEFAGWRRLSQSGTFSDAVGPFYARQVSDTEVECALKAEARHMNPGGRMHGGCLMTLADITLFAICRSAVAERRVVTLQLDSAFLDGVRLDEIVVGSGRVTRASRSLIFASGLLSVGERAVLSFTGIMKILGSG